MGKAAFSVAEFCRELGISRGFFYQLLKDAKGPKTMKLGRRTLISCEAADDWRKRMESATHAGGDRHGGG